MANKTTITTEDKEKIRELFGRYTAGEILVEMANLCENDAKQAQEEGDVVTLLNMRHAEGSLLALAPGIDKLIGY